MSVVGYNVDHDSGDACCGIEMNPETLDTQGHPTATLYIDQEEIGMTYDEVCAFEHELAWVRRQMEWAMASWVYAKDGYFASKTHLMRKGEHAGQAKAVCGARVKQWETLPDRREWHLSPLVGEIKVPPSWVCKRCFAVYQKEEKTC